MLRDVIVNIAIYIPLGAVGHLVLRRSRLPLFSFYAPVLLGLLLSTSVELLQLYTPRRTTSLMDVTTNVIGSIIGVAAGVAFESIVDPSRPRRSAPSVNRGALMLAFCWVAWLFFPFFPALSRTGLAIKIRLFIHAPVFAFMPFLSAAAIWFAAGLLLERAGASMALPWLAISILAIPAQFLITERQPSPSDLFGAITGLVLFALRQRNRAPTKAEAAAYMAIVALRGLSPFHLAAASARFDWTPFGGLLASDWQSAVLILLQKVLYYGSAIWLLRTAGFRLRGAVILVALLLAGIEIAQTRLPGRTPEITDPLLAILLGFTLAILSREKGKRFQSAG